MDLIPLTDVTVRLDSIFNRYESDKVEIINLSKLLNANQNIVDHFFRGNTDIRGYQYGGFEKLEGALASLNASYWSEVMSMTNILDLMPADKKSDWGTLIHEMKTPPFERKMVTDTLMSLYDSRDILMAEKVDSVFKNLSSKHVTNSPMAFRERMIMSYFITSYDIINSTKLDYIHDLRTVVAQLRGTKLPHYSNTSTVLHYLKQTGSFGKWHEYDGGAFKIRIYKVGTVHIEVHPEIAMKLNRLLSLLYPNVIASKDRKEKVAKKDIVLRDVAISYGTADIIANFAKGRFTGRYSLFNYDEEKFKELLDVLKFIGGEVIDNYCYFKYNPSEVLMEIARTLCYPDPESHQYFPTKETMRITAQTMLGMDKYLSVLEPSAGQGNLLEGLGHYNNRITVIDISSVQCEVLKAKGYKNVLNMDFLDYEGEKFDRIIMNPPFTKNQALDHVKKAYEVLNNDGILVAILPASFNNKKFLGDDIKINFSPIFKEEFDNTGVSTVIAQIWK